MDCSDDHAKIKCIIRREAATTGGYIYLVRLEPSKRTTYVRWETVPQGVQAEYLRKHPTALNEEKRSLLQPPALLKSRKPARRKRSELCVAGAEHVCAGRCLRKAPGKTGMNALSIAIESGGDARAVLSSCTVCFQAR